MNLENKLEDFLHHISINQNNLNEWYLSDFINENIKILSSYESFEFMKTIIPYLVNYPEYGYELLEITQELKRQADTTEIFYTNDIPKKLIEMHIADESLTKIINNIFK